MNPDSTPQIDAPRARSHREPRILKEPGAIVPNLRLTDDGRLQLQQAGTWRDVRPVRCFPWSAATRFISLRDSAHDELLLVDDVRELDAATRRPLLFALQIAGFLLEITSVESIEEDFEIRAWKVRTQRGPRSFQTALDAWPHPSPGGGHLIEDVAGDVFFVPPLSDLDTKTQKLLWPYVD